MTGQMGRRAFVGLLVAGLLMQAALAKTSYNSNENDQNDKQNNKIRPQSFRQGNEYVFQYDTQISTGLVLPSSVSSDVETPHNGGQSGQKSVSRLQAQATINFITENRATLELSQLRTGRLNDAISTDPKRIQPMRIFEATEEMVEHFGKLKLPIDFVYVDGIVERINFHPDDSVWSKNVKRAVLNQIQVNLKRKTNSQWSNKQQQQKFAQQASQESQEEQSSFSNAQVGQGLLLKSFVVPETSVEGICQMIYTINDNTNSKYEKSTELQQGDDEESTNGQFNVTKSINFKNCRKIADISFGYQPQESVKAAKCARAMQNANANGRFAPIDDESCDPKELDNTKLDRSTVQRIELVGNAKRFGIKRSETVSHYMLKNFNAQTSDETAPSAMHTISVVQLVFRSVKSSQNPSKTSHFQLRDSESKNGGESTVDSLLYDNEWERTVKEFYMLGDEQFNAQNSPFKHVQKKAEQAQQIVRLLMQAWNDKQNVMEGETVAQLHRLVHIFRMSTVEELKEIQSAIKSVQQATGQNSRADAQKTEQLFADALAIAGTRNTVYLLVQKIHNGELLAEQAAHSLKKLHNIPAPSDAITTMIGQLAKNEIAHRSPALQQSAWLTFGAMVNQMFRYKISTKVQQKEQQPERPLSQQQQLQGPNGNEEKTNGGQQEMLFGTQNGFPSKESAGSLMKKESYKQMLIKNYQQAQTTYEKVLALKAIGNAGLDNTVSELEKIANGKTNESPMIRAVAIDALRRLRSRMPRKIQRIVLPIFQNTNERSEVRMTAFAALINSQPEAPILDQVLYTLSKERSRQVQSYAYSTAKALSESEVPESQNIAKHLKSALQLTGVSEKEMSRDSLKIELPFQWSESGAILKLVTMYTEKQSLPAQLAFGLDSIFNGQRNIDSARLSLAQQGTQGWLENAVEALLNGNKEDSNDKTTRDRRQQATNSRRADEELRSLIPGLQIKSRQQSQQQQSKYAPFAMASLRFGDVDQAMFALDQHSLPQPLRQLLEKGESAPIAAIVLQLAGQLENQHVRWINAVQLNEKTAHVPTSAGVPLKIGQSTPVLISVDANAKVQTSGQALDSSSVKAFVNAHIAVTAVHLQKMETWTPVQSCGVMSKRSVELQAPIQAEIYTENNEEKNPSGVKIALKVPQTSKMHLFGAHSFAATYIIDQINMHRHIDAHTSNAIKMRAIRNPALQQTLSETIEMNEQCYGENAIGIPFCVSGHFRTPNQPTSAAQWLQIVMATENDIHVSLQPKGNGPRAIVVDASGELFKRAAAGQVKEGLNQLEKFYENAEDNFHPAYPEEYRDIRMNTFEERRYKLEQILKKLTQEKQFFYKHSLKLSVRTESGDKKNVNAQLKVQAIADSRLKTVCVIADVQRSPFFAHENQPWTLKAKAQFLMPETVSSPAELERLQSSKQQTFLGKIDAEWGTDRKENVNIRVQGNNAQRKNVNDEEQRALTNQWSSDEIKQQMHKQQRAASFINHFEVAVTYKLNPQSQNAAKRFFDNKSQKINIRSLWNSDSQQLRNGRDGQIYASLTINPQTAKQANVQLRTPTEIIKVNDLELPTPVRLMPLIKHGEKSTHSVAQFLSRVTRDATRDECKVDGRRVMSFDGPVFKGPITTKCYQVLALDCVNAEQPKFAVLMRSLDASGQQKKIKVMTPEQVVECQAKPSGNGDKKIECKINGQSVIERQAFPRSAGSSEEQRSGHPIVEYNNDEQTAATITAPNGAVSVRFAFQGPNGDSQKATIRLANKHKYGQCGLCGHYDDTLANEWRMNNGESTNDLAAFQRSYTVLGNNVEGEICTKESAQAQYEKTKNAFSAEMFNDNKNDWAMLSKKENKKNNRDSQDAEWRRKNFGGYLSEDSQEDRDFFSYGRKSNLQKKIEPVMKTKVIERNHEVCLSVKPLKQCPEGTVPASSSDNKKKSSSSSSSSSSENGSWGAWDSEDEGEKSNFEFVCMDRSDAYPYLRDISNKGVASNPQSVFGGRKFQMDVRQPSKCKPY